VFLTYFSNQPYTAYDPVDALTLADHDHPARQRGDAVVLFSNRHFDPVAGAELYRERLAEYRKAEEVGFDAIMFNEHHGTPTCMSPRTNLMAATVAAQTSRIRLLVLGNPLPLTDNPVFLSEELAMLDLLSGGRLIAGMVRGGGPEQLLCDANPAFNRERFEEAHDLIVKSWTVPGPFRWDGDHYHARVVNPWVRPLQQPHPPVFMSGITSPESIRFAAAHGYPYVGLNTTLEATKRIWDLYDDAARAAGREPGSEHRGYLMRCFVADSDAEARRHAEQYLYAIGDVSVTRRAEWAAPTGYASYEARRARVQTMRTFRTTTLDEQLASGMQIAGTPDTVVEGIRPWLEETRVGTLVLMATEGRIPHEAAMRCIELMGQEVLPAVREMADELGIRGPFDEAPTREPAGAARSRSDGGDPR
jgi:alkanesulfonate monooxygenase SsuD/methylene tetrahydromethanopterin reductase-like flavin-dependent oxidoreductase (luciferase family)